MSIHVSEKDKQAMITNLATMLNAGIPILEAIDALMADSKGGMRTLLKLIQHTLDEGKPLSHAFEQAPKVFDPVTINLIKSAEEGGSLDTSLTELATNLKRQAAFRDRLRSSLIYPAFVMATFAAILVLILTFVIPRLGKVFTGLRVELPPATKFLIAVSDFLLSYYVFIIIGFVGFTILLIVLYKANKRAVINAFMQLPLLRKLGVEIDLTRFTHSMAQLLHAGIPIVEALELSEHVVSNKKVRNTVRDCQDLVTGGRPFSEGLQNHHDIIPVMMLQLVNAAEKSGSLDTAMQELSHHFELQVRNSLKAFTTLLEPITLVLIGVLVGAMMLAVMAPMYNMINQIGPRA